MVQGQVVAETGLLMPSVGQLELVQMLMIHSPASSLVLCKTDFDPPQRQLHIPLVLFSIVPLGLGREQLPPLPLVSWLLWLFCLA